MNLKHLSALGLLAIAPVTHAAMHEMNDAELAAVDGQAMLSGRLFNYSTSFAWNPDYSAPDFDVTTTPVLGGVQVDTGFSVNWEVFPTWSFGVTGKYSGTPYYTTSGSGNWDPIDFSWSNRRTFILAD